MSRQPSDVQLHSFYVTQLRLITCGVLSSIAYIYLAINSQEYAQATLSQLLMVSGLCAALSIWAYLHYSHHSVEVSWPLIFIFAVIFRIIGWFAFPILEDDVFRYMWDGRMTVETGSPYGLVPADFFEADLNDRFEDILGLINYPYIATIYGPICQWVFALAYLIAPGEVWPLQLIFGLADIALILALSRLSKPLMVLLYAWSPLIIKEFAFTAHPDVLGAMFLILAYLAYRKQAFMWVGGLLALATGVKVFAIIMVPFLLGWQWRGWLMFFAIAIGVSIPFGIAQAWLPAGLKVMNDAWLFNAPIYTLLLPWSSIANTKLLLFSAFLIGGGLYGLFAMQQWWLNNKPLQEIRADLLFAGLFICLPALNVWYMVWLLPFAALRPNLQSSLWAWVASIVVLLAYASGINLENSELGPYEHYNWLLAIEFGLIGLAVVAQSLIWKTKN